MTILLILLIAWFGALVRTVFGFGEALVTMPLLALIAVNLKSATALIGALGLIVAIPATIKYHNQINFSVVKRLVVGSLLGVPVGIILVTFVKTALIIHLLGIFLIGYGGYSLFRQRHRKLTERRLRSIKWDYVTGIVSGILGAAYNSHGVPVAIYGTLKQWSAQELRGILQAHFVCVGTIVVLSQLASGFWSWQVVQLLLLILPGLLIVIPFGNWISNRIDSDRLIRYIYGLLILFGLLLFMKH